MIKRREEQKDGHEGRQWQFPHRLEAADRAAGRPRHEGDDHRQGEGGGQRQNGNALRRVEHHQPDVPSPQ